MSFTNRDNWTDDYREANTGPDNIGDEQGDAEPCPDGDCPSRFWTGDECSGFWVCNSQHV